jgi:hypothetical protein
MLMKTPILPPSDANAPSTTRRRVLKAAASGAGLSLLLPGSHLFAATPPPAGSVVKAVGPTLAMGYWQHINLKAMSKITADDVVADARSLAPSPGTYELRVLGVNTKLSLAMDAQYSGASHRFWQAWTEQGLLQHSPNSTIRWWADNTKPLPLNVSLLGGSATTQVTAQAGTFVLAIGPNAQALPAWSDLALRPKTANSKDLQLVSRSTGAVVTFPYAVFSVQPIVA